MTTAWNWSSPPAYWPDLRMDYEPRHTLCDECGEYTEPDLRYWCGGCLMVTCHNCQDREPCRACQRLHDDERDYAEVDGQFGLGLAFPCPYPLCNREGKHRHRVTPL